MQSCFAQSSSLCILVKFEGTIRYAIDKHSYAMEFSNARSTKVKMVTIKNNSSKPSILCFGVPQGSVFGTGLFILCTKPLSNLIERHSISSQSFADDTELLDSCHPDHLDTNVQRMQNCISEVKSWMDCNKLKLNDDKTESILIKSDRIMLPDSAPTSIRVGNSDIPFASHARHLGLSLIHI